MRFRDYQQPLQSIRRTKPWRNYPASQNSTMRFNPRRLQRCEDFPLQQGRPRKALIESQIRAKIPYRTPNLSPRPQREPMLELLPPFDCHRLSNFRYNPKQWTSNTQVQPIKTESTTKSTLEMLLTYSRLKVASSAAKTSFKCAPRGTD